MQKISLWKVITNASLMLIAFTSVPSPGQESPQVPGANSNNDGVALQEVIVTARRREEVAQDVPMVVDAITTQTLDALNLLQLEDVSTVVPGLNITESVTGLNASATLRGVDFNADASGNNGTVEFYLNDAPIPPAVVTQSLFDVQQIEVLRGPQGTLRGRASPSGSITITTHTPDLDEAGGYAEATANNLNGTNLNGALNLPLIDGKLAIRLAGLFEDRDANDVRSINDPNVEPYIHTRAERASVHFAPIDDLDIIGSYEHFQSNTQAFTQVESANYVDGTQSAAVAPLTPGNFAAVQDSPTELTQIYETYNLRASWKFAGQSLHYVGQLTNNNILTYVPNDTGNAFNNAYPGNVTAPNAPLLTGFTTTPNLKNALDASVVNAVEESNEIRLSSDERLFGFMDYVVGGLFLRQTNPFDGWSQLPLFFATPSPATPYTFINLNLSERTAVSHENSFFGNLTFHLGDKTNISVGGRHIQFTSDAALEIQSSPTAPPAPLGNPVKQDYNPWIYSISINHEFNDNLMVYASTGSSWRASTETNDVSDTMNAFPWGRLESFYNTPPETSKSYEIGLKSEWLDKRLLFNLTGYHQTYSNFFYSALNVLVADRLAVPAGGSLTGPNAGDSYAFNRISTLSVGVPVNVNGVESDFAFMMTPHWNMKAEFSYSIGKIHGGVIPCNNATVPATPAALVAENGGQQVASCVVSSRAGSSPPLSATVQSEYFRPIARGYDGFIRGLAAIYGPSGVVPANPGGVSSYALVNLYTGIRDPRSAWEITGYVKNLFNTLRVLTRDPNPLYTSADMLTPAFAVTGTLLPTGYRDITTNLPREIGVNVRYSFGSR